MKLRRRLYAIHSSLPSPLGFRVWGNKNDKRCRQGICLGGWKLETDLASTWLQTQESEVSYDVLALSLIEPAGRSISESAYQAPALGVILLANLSYVKS